MPKAVKRERSLAPSNSDLFIYKYDGKRVIAKRTPSYRDAIQTCRLLFPDIPIDHTIQFNTKDLAICENEMAVISEETWEMVIEQLKSVVIIVERSTKTCEVANSANLTPSSQVRNRKTTVKVTYHGDYEYSFEVRLTPSTKVSHLLDKVALHLGKDPQGLKLGFDGERMDHERTIESYNIEDGDRIHCVISQCGGKPVIYLFSPRPMKASVKLSLAAQWDLSAIYPVVPIKPRTEITNEEISWKVEVHPNGDLTELTTGLNVAYLFWEAHTNPTVARALTPSPSPGVLTSFTENVDDVFYPNSADLSEDNSVVLSIDKITPYLDKALSALCLHTEARTSFITYWLPSLLKHKHVALRFVPQRSYEHAAPLAVSPAPDIITRIFMVFKGIEDEELDKWSVAVNRADQNVLMWQDVVGVDPQRAQDTTLFRVLEWGGMEVLRCASS